MTGDGIMNHNMVGVIVEVTDDILKCVLESAGSWSYTAVKAVVYYSKYYAVVGGVRTLYFGDAERTYSINEDGRLMELDSSTGLMVDSKVSLNNRQYEVATLRLLGGCADIVDGKTLDGKNNNAGHILVHQLVIAAFKLDELILKCKTTSSVEHNHKNGCHWCNKLSNLELCTTTENRLHGAILGILIKYNLFRPDYSSIGFSIKDCYKALEFFRPGYTPTCNWVKSNVLVGAHAKMLAYKLIG